MRKLIIFDLDGTLVNSIYDLADSMNYALKKYGFPTHETEKYKKMVGSGISVLADKAMVIPVGSADPDMKKALLADYNEYYNIHCMDKTRPYENIKELLDELDKRNIFYSVMSNKPDIFSKKIVETLFPENKFASIWGKRDGFERKPSPQSVWALIDELNVKRDECLYIGDSDVDAQTAQNAGLKFCGVEWGFRSIEELQNAGAELIVKTPLDILTVIQNETNA